MGWEGGLGGDGEEEKRPEVTHTEAVPLYFCFSLRVREGIEEMNMGRDLRDKKGEKQTNV